MTPIARGVHARHTSALDVDIHRLGERINLGVGTNRARPIPNLFLVSVLAVRNRTDSEVYPGAVHVEVDSAKFAHNCTDHRLYTSVTSTFITTVRKSGLVAYSVLSSAALRAPCSLMFVKVKAVSSPMPAAAQDSTISDTRARNYDE